MFSCSLHTEAFMRPRCCIGREWRHWSRRLRTQKCMHAHGMLDMNCRQCLVILATIHCHLSSPYHSPPLFHPHNILHSSHAYSYGLRLESSQWIRSGKENKNECDLPVGCLRLVWWLSGRKLSLTMSVVMLAAYSGRHFSPLWAPLRGTKLLQHRGLGVKTLSVAGRVTAAHLAPCPPWRRHIGSSS
jgi:hypothetical protein